MLVINNISLFKADHQILDQVSFRLAAGESLAVIDQNNTSKSQLLACLAGLENNYTGTIEYHDDNSNQNIQPSTALVLANPDNQFISFTVEEELAVGLENRAVAAGEISRKVIRTLSDFSLTELAHLAPSQLSGGEKQRTALAAMLITEPDILLLDNPCSMIDDKAKIQLLKYIFNYQAKQIILSTDNTEETLFCTHLLILNNGKTQFFGPTETVYLTHYREIINLNFDLPLSILEKLNKIE